MKIEYKVFSALFFSALSIPFIFFAYLLMKMEYLEYFVYGTIEKARIVNIDVESGSSSGEYGDDYIFDIEILSNPKLKDKKYSIRISISVDSNMQNKKDLKFVSNAKINDLVTVKILSSHQTKVLIWNQEKINSKIGYWGKFWRWVLISILILIPTYIYYRIYKVLKVKTEY